MKIEKLPSGSYRIRQQIEGTRYSLVFDHKPTQKEISVKLSEEINKKPRIGKYMTFEQACDEYLKIKSNVLSPSTIGGYVKNKNVLPEYLLDMNIYDFTGVEIQTYINTLALDHSPKYCRNIHGFISTVLKTFNPELHISTTLPKKALNEPYIPTKQDIKTILDVVAGTEYEVAYNLAMFGLRRSEICALTIDDIEGNVVHITKAMVQDKDYNWIIKNMPKTDTSIRDIYIPDRLVELIHQQGYIYSKVPNTLSDHLRDIEDKLGMPRFTIHKFRHYFASQMSTITDEATVMAMGGWKTDHVMKTIYRHATKEAMIEAQKQSVSKLVEGIYEG